MSLDTLARDAVKQVQYVEHEERQLRTVDSADGPLGLSFARASFSNAATKRFREV
jgi:hypothetical protein